MGHDPAAVDVQCVDVPTNVRIEAGCMKVRVLVHL